MLWLILTTIVLVRLFGMRALHALNHQASRTLSPAFTRATLVEKPEWPHWEWPSHCGVAALEPSTNTMSAHVFCTLPPDHGGEFHEDQVYGLRFPVTDQASA